MNKLNSPKGYMMRIVVAALTMGLLSAVTSPVFANEAVETDHALTDGEFSEARAILAGFAKDYAHDHMAIDAYFGIMLDDRFWTVEVKREETASSRGRLTDHSFGPHNVTISDGVPAKPTWYFEIADMNVLRLIASGDINAGTAAMQSFGSDEVGVETRDMEGFKSTSGDEADLYLLLSHFFTKGKPEVTIFSHNNSLETHGAMTTSLHTMKGFRVFFFSIAPQEVANEDPRLEAGQVPNLFVVTSGKGTLISDDGPMVLEKGMSVFIPQFVKHQIVNDGDEPLEGLGVLYGDNSDFAFGTSYPAFMQDLNEFYRQHEFRK
jgi:mannose-6-phosphate isomerase-like protein (cupin superfamily)